MNLKFTEALAEQLQHIQITDEVENSWKSFRDTFYTKAYETLCSNERRRQDWFDEDNEGIIKLLGEKQNPHMGSLY